MIHAIHSAVSGLRVSAQRVSHAASKTLEAAHPVVRNNATASSAFAGYMAQGRLPVGSGAVGTGAPELSDTIVDMKVATQSYKASLTVLSVAQEMSRVVLDREV